MFKGFFKDKMILISIFLIILILFIGLSIQGCAQRTIVKKEIVTKKVYVKSPCPKLKVFDINKTLILNAYNKDGKICIDEWGTCIPKQRMIELISYIKYLKEVNNKYKKEIKEYNTQFTNKK